MERRKAVIAAATASLTLLAGAAAISLNTGIVGASGDDGPGQISPVDATTPPATIYIGEPAADQATPRGSTSEAPSVGSSASRSGDDDRDENEDDGPEAEDHEYEFEGADDDD